MSYSSLRRQLRFRSAWPLGLTLLLLPGPAAAALKVVTVPYVQSNPAAPHPAYNGHHTTFKAIARDVPGGCTLKFRWNIEGDTDAQGQDLWDACPGAGADGWVTASSPYSQWNLSCRKLLPQVVPQQQKKKVFTAKIQANCGAENAYGTYPVIVYAEVGQGIDLPNLPAADRATIRAGPADPDWALEVKRAVSVDDALWYLHNYLGHGGSGSAIDAGWNVNDPSQASRASAAMWSFVQNGHTPAYPPGTYSERIGGVWQVVPANQLPLVLRDNDTRYNADPYAEDGVRLLNYVLGTLEEIAVRAAREDDRVDGVAKNRIDGKDGKGLKCKGCAADACGHTTTGYAMGHLLGTLGASGMGGTVAQVGAAAVKEKKLELVAQNMVDFMCDIQSRTDADGGTDGDGGRGTHGAWGYGRCDSTNPFYSDFSAGQWILIGLESAELGMKDFGVIVPDDTKYRTARLLYENMKRGIGEQYVGGGSYRNSYYLSSNYNPTLAGGLLVGLGWLGVNKLSSAMAGWDDINNAHGYWKSYAGYNYKQMKEDTYDKVVSFLGTSFYNCDPARRDCWNNCMFKHENAKYGVNADATAVELGMGNVYAMYSVQKGARTIHPELKYLGPADNQKDWYREMSYYFVNNQAADGSTIRGWNNATHSDASIGIAGMTAIGGVLVQTPTVFDPKPVAIGSASPMQVLEGCSGAGQAVSFRHELSYNQNPQRVFVEYQWIFDTSDKGAGEDWYAYFNRYFGVPQLVADPGALPALDEYVSAGGQTKGWHGRSRLQLPTKSWQLQGTFAAALRVVDDKGITDVTTVTGITVTKQAAVKPTVVHGGPYVIRAGEALALQGNVSDGNTPCGDSIVDITWKVWRGAAWEELPALVAAPVIAWAQLPADLPRATAIPLQLEATDSTARTTVAETELTIYSPEPVACFTLNTDPIGCQDRVTVTDCSRAQDPRYPPIKWEWDYQGDGTVDAFGQSPDPFGYATLGQKTIELTVSDELGVQGSTTRQVTVEPRQSPAANAGGPYVLATWLDDLERRVGGTVRLDGSRSSDPDSGCGDSIVKYEWDVDGDGQFDDGLVSPAPGSPGPPQAALDLPWATLLARLSAAGKSEADFLAGRNGLPTVPIRLRVTDTSGRTHTALTMLAIYHNAPIPAFTITPQIAACLQAITFEAAGSTHGMPPHQINTYQWDFDVKEGEVFVPEASGYLVTHDYDAFGIYHPVLKVIDDQGRSALLRQEVLVQQGNNPPRVDAGGPYAVVVGEELRLDASGTEEPDRACGDKIVKIEWDLDGDGVYDVQGNDANGDGVYGESELERRVGWDVLGPLLETPAQYPANPRTGQPMVSVRLRVTDGFGASQVGTTQLSVYRREPYARPRWEPEPAVPVSRVDAGTRKGTVMLNGSDSYAADPRSSLSSYSWSLYENNVWIGAGAGATTSKELSFGNEVVFPVTRRFRLTVADAAGRQGSQEFEVTFAELASAPPRVILLTGSEQHIVPGDRLSVRASVSDADATANPASDWIALIRWKFDGVTAFERPLADSNGDGAVNGLDQPDSQLELEWAQLAAYGLQSPGEHVLVLQAVDRGGTMGQATMRLQVYAAAMIAVAGVVPASGGCTTSFAFDGGASRHVLPGQQIIMYRWDFDGGDYDLASPLPTATHVYRRFGSFPVKLLVQDAKAREASTTLTISTVDGNLPPVVLHGGPYFVDKGLAESLVLDARGSFEPDAACTDRIVEYRWDLDGDGVFEHRFPGPQSTLSFAQLGYLPRDVKLTVTLEAEDTLGSKTRVQTTLQLADGTPAAAFRFTPDPSSCGQEVSFDASTSVHPRPGRQIVKYEWDFAYDGAFDVMLATDKPIVKHTFRSMGGQRVALRVTDDGVPPRTDLEEARPMVSGDNLPPVASTGGTIKAAHGEALVLDARASFDPNANCGDAVVSYEWDLNNDVNGNGQFDRSSAQPQLTVPWADVLALRANQAAPADRTGKPSYPVRLRVKDKLDATHVIETLVVFYDPVPVAKPSVRPDTVGCGTDMFFSGLGSFNIHPDRPLQRYVWDFGDGSAVLDTAQAEVAYRYQRMSWVNGAAAPYKAKLTVKDVLGRASQPAEVNATLSFANRPPVADPGGPYVTSRINDAVTPVKLNGGSSFDPDAPCDGITLYEWDTDNDGLFGAQDGNGSPYCLANSDCVGAVIERFGSNQWQNGTRIPVSLRVTDAYGQQTVSEPVYVEVVDTAPPMVQLTSPNGGEILAGRALVSLTYGLISASGGKKVVLQLSVNGTAVTPLDPATGQPLCAGAGCNSVEVDADGTGTMVAASYRFDTRAFASRLDAYRLQVLAYVKTAPELRTTVFSRRAFSIDNEAPTLTIDDARLAQTSGNLVTWRLSTLGRPVVGVRVAGSFNQWSQDNLADEWQLRDGNGDGVWQLTHRLDDGSHQYKLVLFFQDGHKEWWLDPQNPATAPDGYGGLNNVQSVPVSYLLATLEQLSASGTRFVLQGVAVSDSLDASPSLTVTHAGTDQPWSLDRVYPLGTTKMTLMARDWAGNTTAREVAVLIRDTTKPTVGTGPPVTLEATSPAGTPVRLQPMFWDLCDASLQVTATATDAGGQPVAVVKSAVDGSYGGSFPLGESTVVLRADDDSGNFNAASVKVTINDTTPPTIVLPDAMARFSQSAPQGVPSADAPLPVPQLLDNGSPAAQLACSAAMTLRNAAGAAVAVSVLCGEAPPAALFFPPGETPVTYTVRDARNNQSTAVFTVLVTDADAPEVLLVAPVPRSDIWYGAAVEVRFRVVDATDVNPQVTVEPLPAGVVLPAPVGGVYTLRYDADGAYDIRITAVDNQNNRSMRIVPHFGIDRGRPTITVADFPSEGVDPANEATFPLFFTGESMAPAFTAADPLSGIGRVEGKVLPGLANGQAVVLFSQEIVLSGSPLSGKRVLGNLRCTDRPDVCIAGALRLRGLKNGVQRIVVNARDALGNTTELTLPFKMSDLDEALRVALTHVAAYKLQHAALAAKLGEVERLLTTGQRSLRRGYLGGCLISIEDAVKLMETDFSANGTRFGAIPDLEKDAAMLVRGAYSETHIYFEDEAIGSAEEVKSRDYLQSARSFLTSKLHSSAALACENAYFYTSNAETPLLAIDVFSSLEVIAILLRQMDEYRAFDDELPGQLPVWSAAEKLRNQVRNRLEILKQWGGLAPGNFIDMLLALQDLTQDLRNAENQGTWVRNWQWGIGQMTRVVIDIAKADAENILGRQHCRIVDAQARYDESIAMLNQRDVDEMLKLYSRSDVRCLIVYIYQDAGYAPLRPPAGLGCWVDPQGKAPACPLP